MNNTDSLPVPPVPQQFELIVILNRALFAYAAVKSQAAVLSAEENKLKMAVAELEAAMAGANIITLGSNLGSANVHRKRVYHPDWPTLHAHIQKTGEFDLVQRRVNNTAMRDRETNNELPPGVKVVDLAETKLALI